MQTRFFPYGICILLTGFAFPANAEKVSAPYKLGQAYTSEINNKVKCLEGHSGAIIGNAGCKDFSRSCKSDSDCSGFGALASSSSDGAGYKCSSVTKQCEYQECNSTSVCVNKYSHMRSCVNNGRGVKECRITCNWQKIIEAGKGIIGSMNVAKRMQFENSLWTNFNGTSLNSLALTGEYIGDKWYTCRNGAVSRCQETNINTSISSSTWAEVQKAPCLPCSIASGGTWGIGNEESINAIGSRGYAVYMSKVVNHDNLHKYVSSTGTVLAQMNMKGCGSESALRYGNAFSKMNNTTPFMRWTGHDAGSSRFGLSGAVELGASNICFVWQTKSSSGTFSYRQSTSSSCTQPCVQSTEVAHMVYVPQQSAIRYFPSASSPTGGSTFVRHNFNRSGGTLLCCAIGSDASSIDGNKIKHCIVVK